MPLATSRERVEVEDVFGPRSTHRRTERIFCLAAFGAVFGGISGLGILTRLLVLALFGGQQQPPLSQGLIVSLLAVPGAAALGGLLTMAVIGILGGRPKRRCGTLNGAIAGTVALTVAGLACFLGLIVVSVADEEELIDPAIQWLGCSFAVAGFSATLAWLYNGWLKRYGRTRVLGCSAFLCLVAVLALQALPGATAGFWLGASAVLATSGMVAGVVGVRRTCVRHRRSIFWFTLLLGLIFATAMAVCYRGEARTGEGYYHGKSFRYWSSKISSDDVQLRATAIEVMKQALESESNPYNRVIAASNLLHADPADVRATKALIDALHDPDRAVRKWAVSSLRIGNSENVTRALIETALHDEDMEVRHDALGFLPRLHSETAIAILIKALKDQKQEVRARAVDVLRFYGAEAKAAIPALNAASKEEKNAAIKAAISQAVDEINDAFNRNHADVGKDADDKKPVDRRLKN